MTDVIPTYAAWCKIKSQRKSFEKPNFSACIARGYLRNFDCIVSLRFSDTSIWERRGSRHPTLRLSPPYATSGTPLPTTHGERHTYGERMVQASAHSNHHTASETMPLPLYHKVSLKDSPPSRMHDENCMTTASHMPYLYQPRQQTSARRPSSLLQQTKMSGAGAGRVLDVGRRQRGRLSASHSRLRLGHWRAGRCHTRHVRGHNRLQPRPDRQGRLEGSGRRRGHAHPVQEDYSSGHIRQCMVFQICAQRLLLRASWHDCSGGVVYHAAHKRQAESPHDISNTKTLRTIHGVKIMAQDNATPPPPPDVPRRSRCSLADICPSNQTCT